jgi:hypothetical protein
MQSADLTPEQASRIVAQLRPMLAYLRRLVTRMDKRRFPSDDPLFRVALRAHDALHELHVHMHYLSRTSGAGRLPPDPHHQPQHDRDERGGDEERAEAEPPFDPRPCGKCYSQDQ